MYVERHDIALATDASGDDTAYSAVLTGRVLSVIYTVGSSAFDNTVDFTITAEATGETILTQSNVSAAFVKAPRQATHATDGTASLYAAAGEPVEDYIALAKDRVKVVVAQGGNTKNGTITVVVG